MRGKIKQWFTSKSSGFIVGDHDGKDVFVHASALTNPRQR